MDARLPVVGDRSPRVFRELALPKVNLTLRVLGRRIDGYHEIDSLVVFARDPAAERHGPTSTEDDLALDQNTVADVLSLDLDRPWRSGASADSTIPSSPTVTSIGPFAGSLAGENLIDVALRAIADAEPAVELGPVILDKRLPIAAGIGGGSADVAALIRAVKRANPDLVTRVDWLGIAKRIGADVPVCLAASAQRMQGLGERLTPVRLPTLDAVLVNPLAPVPSDKTARVFRTLAAAALDPNDSRLSAVLPDFSNRAALLDHVRRIGNDLTRPASIVVPAVADVLQALAVTPACDLAQLSGGGPTCFGIFADAASASAAAASLRPRHPTWWVKAVMLS